MSEEIKNKEGEGELNSFGVPEGYFKSSAMKLLNKVAWEEEHNDFPRLIELRRNDFFIIPSDYFGTSEANLELDSI